MPDVDSLNNIFNIDKLAHSKSKYRKREIGRKEESEGLLNCDWRTDKKGAVLMKV